ncbi:major facilitator superfamily domain-containing protein [Sporodiniella umbellata]|nr:major facilitator superfamily domain-containing protein [Sporodiniella umbellata]
MTTEQTTEVHQEVYAITDEKMETGSHETYVHKEVIVNGEEKPMVMGQEFDVNGNQLKEHIKSAAEKRLVLKFDWIFVMPFIAILNFLQFFDKSAINYAAVMGIKQDTHLTGAQFGWLGSIFYLGYLLFQVPSTFFIQKFPLSKYVGSLIILWGLVLLLTFKCTNFSQLAGLRFLLGFFEAGIYPSCIMMISTLYRRSEQSGRIGVIYMCNGLALILGGLISYGIAQLNSHGLKPWQWVMIILGIVTIVFGIVCFFFMVDNPKDRVLRLTEEEEKIVEARTLDNAVVRVREFKWSHIYESIKEPRYYAFNIIALLINFQNSALSTFSTTITSGFGFSGLQSILLTIPSGASVCLFIIIAVFVNRRYGHTLLMGCFSLAWAILGLILILVIPVMKVKLIGLVLIWAYCASFVMLLTSVANNVTGYTKKIFYSCSIMVFYTLGNFIGPFLMIADQAPVYLGGMVGYIVADFISILLFLALRWSMIRENRKRLANPVKTEVLEDMTDVENKSFIYRP